MNGTKENENMKQLEKMCVQKHKSTTTEMAPGSV